MPTDGLIPTQETIWIKLLGPNYKIRRAALCASLNEALYFVAIAPYTLGEFTTIIPAKVKAAVALTSLAAKIFLKLLESWNSKATPPQL